MDIDTLVTLVIGGILAAIGAICVTLSLGCFLFILARWIGRGIKRALQTIRKSCKSKKHPPVISERHLDLSVYPTLVQ